MNNFMLRHLEEELNHMMPEEKFDLKDNEQRQFHYFKIHDHNNDNRMDGIELGEAGQTAVLVYSNCSCETELLVKQKFHKLVLAA